MRSQCVPGSQKNREPGYEARSKINYFLADSSDLPTG